MSAMAKKLKGGGIKHPPPTFRIRNHGGGGKPPLAWRSSDNET